MRKILFVIVVSLFSYSSTLMLAQTPPATKESKPAAAPDTEPSIGPMRVRQLPAFDFVYVTRTTTRLGLARLADAEMAKLMETLKTHNIQPSGGAVFIYHNATGDPNQQISIDMGIQIRDVANAPDGYQLKHVDSVHCATVLYGGSLTGLRQAYRELFTSLATRDLISTGETREYFLAWDQGQSANNVILIAACAE
jgi:effector-binding domain-containing protein